MTLQNRVDPWGNLTTDPSKEAKLMGNRGRLHNNDRVIMRHYEGKRWLACDPKFEGIDRKPLFQPSSYSELFFLDEATALSAGHRPCNDCQRPRLNEFKAAWARAFNVAPEKLTVAAIDTQIHKDRINSTGQKLIFEAALEELPNGTMVDMGRVPCLIRDGELIHWSFNGYVGSSSPSAKARLQVLTPSCLVQVLKAGFIPRIHPTVAPLKSLPLNN